MFHSTRQYFAVVSQLILLAGAGVGLAASPASAEQATDETDLSRIGSSVIVAKHSGQCLDVTGASQDNGAAVIQWPCHGGSNQQWSLYNAGDGYYLVTVNHSGQCLDVTGASQDNGAAVIQWPCHGGDNQQWSIVPEGNGYFSFIARHSGQCLDVTGASQDNGAAVIQWPCHGGDNQQWAID